MEQSRTFILTAGNAGLGFRCATVLSSDHANQARTGHARAFRGIL